MFVFIVIFSNNVLDHALIKSDILQCAKLFCLDITRVIFYVRRIGLYLYKYRIYGTISIYILKGLAFVYQLM